MAEQAGEAGRLIKTFLIVIFSYKTAGKQFLSDSASPAGRQKRRVGEWLPINHKEAGKEIETGNVNSKRSFLCVTFKAQPQTSRL